MAAENPFVEFIARYRDDPVALVREVLGTEPDEDQQRIMRAVASGCRRISIRSGHRVGKTTTLAWLTVWHALTRFRQKTICTSATSTQLFEALASETKSCFKRLPEALQSLFEVQVDQIRLKAAPDDSFVSYVVSKAETPEALAGKHSDNVLIICDEASGIPEPVFEAAVGSMAAHNACTILAGNPIRTSGLFFDTHNNPKVMEMWEKFHISCVGNPRITPDFFADVESRYGLESNEYRVRVLGEFPTSDEDTVIPWSLIEASLKRDVAPFLVRPIWGVDPARFGNDATALCKRRGNTLVEKTDIRKGLDTMQTTGWVKSQWDACQPSDRPTEILVDSIGVGAGVCDRLAELGLPARGVNVSESPAMESGCFNLRSELWFKGRAFFEKRDVNLRGDDLLAAELKLPRYKYASNGKKQVESKDDMKKRGVPSPNRADAFLLTLAAESVTAAGSSSNRVSWNQPMKRKIAGIV
jgi:phage terminase large subunit